jgi:DNA repair exonuclease SbcCD nuclease subunit
MRKYNFRKNTIILQGDTHDISVIYHTLNEKIPEGNDYYQIGDGGWGFGNPSYSIDNAKSWLSRINNLCKKNNINCYLAPGNHDNPDVWRLPQSYSKVFLIQSGDIGIFPNNKKVLFVGGGISVDRCMRTNGVDYWVEEPTPTLQHLEKCDIMFSHDCPEYFNHSTNSLGERFQWAIEKDPLLIEDCNSQRINMSNIVKDSGVKTIFSGHYHNAIRQEENNIYYRCLDINELFEFDANIEYKL